MDLHIDSNDTRPLQFLQFDRWKSTSELHPAPSRWGGVKVVRGGSDIREGVVEIWWGGVSDFGTWENFATHEKSNFAIREL